MLEDGVDAELAEYQPPDSDTSKELIYNDSQHGYVAHDYKLWVTVAKIPTA
jgi:hypothetical protein